MIADWLFPSTFVRPGMELSVESTKTLRFPEDFVLTM